VEAKEGSAKSWPDSGLENQAYQKLEPPVRVNGGGSFSLVRMTRLTQLARAALIYFFFLAAFFLVAFFTAFLAVFFFAAFFLATVTSP
jgi:hypothetical protein